MMENVEFLDISKEYKEQVVQLASIKGKDNTWINRQFVLQRTLLIDDAHHGYCLEEAIWSIKENIKTWTELKNLEKL